MAKAAGSASSNQSSGCNMPRFNQPCCSFSADIFQATQAACCGVRRGSIPGPPNAMEFLFIGQNSSMLGLPKKTRIQGHAAINEERRGGQVGGFVAHDIQNRPRRATASPMPELAPVTSARRLFQRLTSGFLFKVPFLPDFSDFF